MCVCVSAHTHASRHSYSNCIMYITYSPAYTSIPRWSSVRNTRSHNDPKLCNYICISNKPATKQEMSCLTKIPLQTDSDQRKVRAYIYRLTTRCLWKVVPRKASIFEQSEDVIAFYHYVRALSKVHTHCMYIVFICKVNENIVFMYILTAVYDFCF
jgi:hypothetical protein